MPSAQDPPPAALRAEPHDTDTTWLLPPVFRAPRPGRPDRRAAGRYGVIAIANGQLPTLMALSAVLVAVRIGVTVSLEYVTPPVLAT